MGDELRAIESMLEAEVDGGSRWISMYYAAYLETTHYAPEEVCLVKWEKGHTAVWEFMHRDAVQELLDRQEETGELF